MPNNNTPMKNLCFLLIASLVFPLLLINWAWEGRCDAQPTAQPQLSQHVYPPQTAHPYRPSPAPSPIAPLQIENATLRNRWATLMPEERVNILVYENCYKSVVNINTQTTRSHFLAGDIEIPGGGSGIVLDREGHILTNFHVVEGVDKVEVTLFNGKSYDAQRIGSDPITDIVVLKIGATPEELFPVSFGDSTQLLVGQKIYAIGNPFGLESTLTSGLISSLNRTIGGRSSIRPIRGTIQIDAAINPGNSGGPLLDTQGRMIGMNTAIASRVEQSSGVGFAIPSNTVQRIVPQILKNGKAIRPDHGIAKVLETEQGLLVRSLLEKGAAQRAGIRGPRIVTVKEQRGPYVRTETRVDRSTADIIVAVNGKTTLKAEDFVAQVEEHNPGDTIAITVLRAGKKHDISVVLE